MFRDLYSDPFSSFSNNIKTYKMKIEKFRIEILVLSTFTKGFLKNGQNKDPER